MPAAAVEEAVQTGTDCPREHASAHALLDLIRKLLQNVEQHLCVRACAGSLNDPKNAGGDAAQEHL